LDSEAIGKLTNLKKLYLNAGFAGTIPTSLVSLRNLESPIMLQTSLEGTIPEEIGQLSPPRTLSHLHSFLPRLPRASSRILQPAEIENTHIGCKLGGTLPSDFTKLTSLEAATFQSTSLGGPTPPLPHSLYQVDFSHNFFDLG
jgi:hypothetical protein